MKSEDIGRQVRTGCLRTIDVMEMSIFNNHHGVVPRRQLWTVPGHHGPSQVTGTSDSRQKDGMRQSRVTRFNLRMLHWNAEGVRNKSIELQVLLKERNTDVCCIQETHLNSSYRFPSWYYDDLDNKGDEVEYWINTHNMVLINKANDPLTFYSKAWRTTSCPDLAIATDDVAKITSREVDKLLGGSDHESIFLTIECQRNTNRNLPKSKLELQESQLVSF